jgi:hypothetical protein
VEVEGGYLLSVLIPKRVQMWTYMIPSFGQFDSLPRWAGWNDPDWNGPVTCSGQEMEKSVVLSHVTCIVSECVWQSMNRKMKETLTSGLCPSKDNASINSGRPYVISEEGII